MKFPTFKFETKKIEQGFKLIAGCDEVGIAPLAGPVVAATVILDPASIGKQRSKTKWWYRVRDSKTVNEKERNDLSKFIQEHCLDFSIGIVSHETVDKINIYHAAMLAMEKSFKKLITKPDFLFLDGIRKIKSLSVSQEAVVDGDEKILSVAAASIIAKVARDEIIAGYHDEFPRYGFVKHKGYPTRQHKEAILKYGVLPVHRKSFTFIRECVEQARGLTEVKTQKYNLKSKS